MRAETISLGVVAAASAALAFYFWRANVGLKNALLALKSDENERISRLEHDLRSPLGALRGFSTLLREYVEKHSEALPAFPLKHVNGIDQAAHKILQIIEIAAEKENECR